MDERKAPPATGTGRQGAPVRRAATHARTTRPSRLPLVAAALVLALVCVGVGLAGFLGQEGGGDDAKDEGFSVSDVLGVGGTENDGSIVMTLGGSADTYVAVGEDYVESGCHALDTKVDGDLTSSVEVSGSVDASKVGDYEVTYSVTNSEGMHASKTRTVHVVDDMDKDKDGIPVLMYHYVYTEDDQPDTSNTNYLLDTKFEKQLKWLTDNDYYYPSYQELAAYIDGTHSLPRKSVVLTFDDGQKGFLKYGIPLLEEYQVPATSFIICNQEKAPKKIVKYASEYVSFQSHSYSCHQGGATKIGRGGHIYDLSKSALVADCAKATEVLGTNEAFAYPYGDVSDVAPAALAEAGYLCAFTIHNGRVQVGSDAMQLPRVRILGESSLEGFKAQVLGEDY